MHRPWLPQPCNNARVLRDVWVIGLAVWMLACSTDETKTGAGGAGGTPPVGGMGGDCMTCGEYRANCSASNGCSRAELCASHEALADALDDCLCMTMVCGLDCQTYCSMSMLPSPTVCYDCQLDAQNDECQAELTACQGG